MNYSKDKRLYFFIKMNYLSIFNQHIPVGTIVYLKKEDAVGFGGLVTLDGDEIPFEVTRRYLVDHSDEMFDKVTPGMLRLIRLIE